MGYHDDMPENQGGQTIMFAPWPKPFDREFRDFYSLDDCYLEFTEAKHELVTQGPESPARGKHSIGQKGQIHPETHGRNGAFCATLTSRC